MAELFTCKMKLAGCSANAIGDFSQVRFTAVWEGSPAQQLQSPNKVFGRWAPYAEFCAQIVDAAVIARLSPGKCYLVTFVEVPEADAPKSTG